MTEYNKTISIETIPPIGYEEWQKSYLKDIEGKHIMGGFTFYIHRNDQIPIDVYLGNSKFIGFFYFHNRYIGFSDSVHRKYRIELLYVCIKRKKQHINVDISQGKLSIKMLYDTVMKYL